MKVYEKNNKLGEYDGGLSHLFLHSSMGISTERVLVEKRAEVKKNVVFARLGKSGQHT